jgi:DNA polymerase-3 subunit epsilon
MIRLRLPLLVAGAVLLALLAAALPLAAIWGDVPIEQRAAFEDLLLPRLGFAAAMAFLFALVVAGAMRWLHGSYIGAPLVLAEQLRLILDANRGSRLAMIGGAELRVLAAAANELAEVRERLQSDVEQQIRSANASLEEEKNRLAALMSELNQSVVVCNRDGRILLYNQRARTLFRVFQRDGGNGDLAAASALLGLGRSIFSVFDRALIDHAVENLQHGLERHDAQPLAGFVTATPAGQLLRVQMAPVLGGPSGDGIAGYVLMLDNITRVVDSDTRRDLLLQQLTEGSRSSLASIRACVENLIDYPDVEAAQRERFLAVIRDEVGRLGARLDETMASHADSLKARWPLEEMRGSEFLAAAQRRIESRTRLATKIDATDATVWIRVDSFSLLQATTYLASRLQQDLDVRLVRLRLSRSGRLAHIDLLWTGVAVSGETLTSWELEPMTLAGESNPLTLRDVMDRHGGEIWFQRESATQQAYFRLLVPLAVPHDAAAEVAQLRGSRPEYYDFDLFKWSEQGHALDDRLLADLTYTVFDTETTGLEPSAGDEIIQIGALRIVNLRVLQQEAFEQLVDPRVPIKAASAQIHGIGDDRVAGQPTIDKVLPQFHRFCADTVLVAHNASFDMRFLQLKEKQTGLVFDHPVLDTLLLSAVLHPNQESHQLEAIARRFGVAVVGRHTALGDAAVTAAVFVRMIPLLAGMGIRTLGQAREASRQTYYARLQY